ncbi:MAG: 16S rRNA (guanine(966)-N(2))-methyltransferase RsmD [Acutalibacteraceae bacterium]
MRVISGTARGRKLLAPEGFDTRPVTDMIKEALFSSWQFIVPGARFLDIFSGSGSMGIEALSRGASKVVFVEKEKKAVEIIKKNLANCKFTEDFTVYQEDAFRVIDRLKLKGEVYDIIYLDPPFTVDEIFVPVLETLSDGKLLEENGIIAIRTRRQKEMPEEIGTLKRTKLKFYGVSAVHFYCGKEE